MRTFAWFVLTAALASGDSHPSWWNFASPEATALVGIQWENLRQSVFGEAVGMELSSSGSLGFPDLPCLQESRQILISSPALLAMATGLFPARTLREQAAKKGLKHASYNGFDLWISSGKATLSVAQMSDQLLLVGLRKTLEAAIDRSLLETGRRYSPLLARAARFSQTQDLWVVATQLPDSLASLFVPLEAEARSFDGAVSVRDGLHVEAALDAGSDRAATEIAETLRRSIPGFPAIAQGLQVTVNGGNVLLALQVNREQLAASLRKGEPVASPAPLPLPVEPPPAPVLATFSLAAPVVLEPPVPKPAEPQIIRIFGLDEGPREIVLPPVGKVEKQR